MNARTMEITTVGVMDRLIALSSHTYLLAYMNTIIRTLEVLQAENPSAAVEICTPQ